MAIYLGNQLTSQYLGNIDTTIYSAEQPPQVLNIGDYYEGGYIYYLSGSYPNYSGYIISQEQSTVANTCFGCYGQQVVNARGTGVGAGLANTEAIVNEGCTCFGAPTAAQVTLDYTGSGYTDWWLPSSGDWQAIFSNYSSFNFITESFSYWTSTENGSLNNGLYFAYRANWAQSIQSGSINSTSKDGGLYFRAGRAFTT